jgi:hypothetical protein
MKKSPVHGFSKVCDLYLDSPTLDVRARFKRLNGILHGEPMSDQLSNASEHTGIDKANSFRPGVGIPVLELEVDLARREAHERELHLILPHADHKHGPSEPHGMDCSGKGALHARTLERDIGFEPAKGDLDPLRELLLGLPALHEVRRHLPGQVLDELPRKVQSALVDVGYDDRHGAGRLGAQEGHKTDGPGTADNSRVAEAELGPLDGGECDGERLEERPVLVGHTRGELVAPHRRVDNVSPQQTGHGGRRAEEDVLAAVVPPGQAGRAGVAGDVGFDGDFVAWLEGRYGRVDCYDLVERELCWLEGTIWGGQTSPADSWPSMCLSVTIIGPMHPACQKCTSDLRRRGVLGTGPVEYPVEC